jgi:hypothetical protein
MREARSQPWSDELARLTYFISDTICHRHQAAARLRRQVTAAGDTAEAWALAARAADLELDGHRLEHALDEALA